MPTDNKTKSGNQRPSTDDGKNSYEFSSYSNRYTYTSLSYGLNILDSYKTEDLIALVQDPMAHNAELRRLSLLLYGTNGSYTNTVDYMCSLPTLDYVIVPFGKNKQKRQQHKQLMESTLRTIRHKEVMRDMLWKGMVEGAAYYYFEDAERPLSKQKTLSDIDVENIVEINDIGKNAYCHALPADYTKIVGIKNNSYVIAFNLDYFDQRLENADMAVKKWPKEIRDAWNAKHNGKKTDVKNWVVLDNTKTMVLKIRSKREERYGRPLVLAAIRDILYKDYFTDTKRGILDDLNNRVLYEIFPEGQVKGRSALTEKQQKAQHDTIKDAIFRKNSKGGTNFFSVAAGTKLDSIDTQNTDLFDEKNENNINDNVALDLGIASALLNGVGSGAYASQLLNIKLVASEVFQWIEQITEELNKVIDHNIIKDHKNRCEVRYLPITHVNREEMVGFACKLYTQGKGSLAFWAAASGVAPEVFEAMLDYELEEDWENKYPVHKTSFTQSAEDSDGGRPTTDNPTENTIRSRANDGNALPSPSD